MDMSIDHTRRHLDFPVLLNARDLGHLPTASGQHTRRGALVRSEYLGFLDEAGRQALLAYGVRAIIDLRFARELAMDSHHFQLNPSGQISYTNISLCGEVGDPHYEPLQAVGDSATAWIEPQLELGRFQIGCIMKVIANAPEGGVLFHCYAGKDRTGLIAELLLSLVDVPIEIIAEDYVLSNERLAVRYFPELAKIEDLAQREHARAEWTVQPETVYKTLGFVQQRYGGTEAYLRHAGLSDAEIAQLRARLLG